MKLTSIVPIRGFFLMFLVTKFCVPFLSVEFNVLLSEYILQ